jgi:hypothetical protein
MYVCMLRISILKYVLSYWGDNMDYIGFLIEKNDSIFFYVAVNIEK